MKVHETLPLLCLSAGRVLVSAAETGLPRGVGPEFAKFYPKAAGTPFTCISHPSITLTHAQVNDDYCDCPDGSDEPGTAACAHISSVSPHAYPHPNASAPGITSGHALPGFYCANAGHNPAYIPFTYVNDGICDSSLCCDGSDEWAQVGGVKCANRCAEIGKEWRRADDARRVSARKASEKRKELVAAAERRRQELEALVKEEGAQIEAAEAKVKRLTDVLAEVEREEARRVVKREGEGGKVGVLAGLAKGRLGELRAALGRAILQRDNMIDRVGELEGILATFKDEYNPNFNDEGVKRAVRAWEEYAARDTANDPGNYDKNSQEEKDVAAIVRDGEAGDGIDWADFERGTEDTAASDDVAALYDLTAYLPPTLRDWLSSQLSSLRSLLEANGILSGPSATRSSGAPESKRVKEAKSRLTSAESALTTQQNSRKTHEEDLARDHGPDDVFRTLKDSCISMDSGEYTYEVCWMGKVTQKSKRGGGQQQNMGTFEGFGRETVDEEVPADGRGLGAGERVTMLFDGGSHCWNGPNRRTTVVMGCSENEEVIKVVEEEKCVYRVEALTPAVCVEEAIDGKAAGRKVRDEL